MRTYIGGGSGKPVSTAGKADCDDRPLATLGWWGGGGMGGGRWVGETMG